MRVPQNGDEWKRVVKVFSECLQMMMFVKNRKTQCFLMFEKNCAIDPLFSNIMTT